MIGLQPDHSEARMSLGTLFYDLGNKQVDGDLEDVGSCWQAIEWFKQAAKVCPDWVNDCQINIHRQIGWAYFVLMEHVAIEGYDDDDLYQLIGVGMFDIAAARVENYERLTEFQLNDAKAFYELGEAYRGSIDPYITLSEDYGNETRDEIEAMKQGKHPEIRAVLEKAKKAYRTAIGIKPYYAEAYSALGEVYHRLGQFEEAIQAFKQAIVLDNKGRNNLAGAYHELGKQYFAGGNYMQAIECYNNAIVTAFRDDHNEVYYDLALADDEVENYELAILWYQRVRSTHANLRHDTRHYESVIYGCTRIEDSYEYPDFHYRLGKAYHRISNYQDAVKAYGTAINRQIAIEEEYDRKSNFERYDSDPPARPEWWTEIYQNYESASRNEPL